ncbi:T9SS type A sorting domain-containing protein [Balneolales bacterium ANBcel1]|nr:T9SS type A sorting domain-containing protein [Balneolales bacterium ANBcel1]
MKYLILTSSIVLWLAVHAASLYASTENRPPDSFFEREDPGLNVFNGEIPAGNRIYVAPDGDNGHPGTEEEPLADLNAALSTVGPGDVIVMRGGIYEHNDMIRINNPDGSESQRIVLTAYPGEVPVLDFINQPKERGYHGLYITADYWHIIGITVRYASHNGIRNDGSHNILEQLTAYGNHDSGIHMAGTASFNLLKNSDSFHNFNYDTERTPRVGNNADGITIKFENIGPGNHIYGCRAWENSDDGYDFWTAPNEIILENSWAINNGDPSVFGNPPDFDGGGNGFKLGGDGVAGNHIVKRSMALDHSSNGFDSNNNTGVLTLVHNTSYNNGNNFSLDYGQRIDNRSVFLNNLSAVSNTIARIPSGAVARGNSWQEGQSLSSQDFESVDTELAKGPRQPDGSLPDVGLLRPKSGTFTVNGGVDLGEVYYGTAPDMGAFEREDGEMHAPDYVLDAPEIQEPVTGSVVITTAADFSWTEVAGALEYEVQLTPFNFYDPSYVEIEELAGQSAIRVPSTLTGDHYYRWRVRARNEEGVSPWSDEPLFYTESELPYLEVAVVSPRDGATVSPEETEFVWEPAAITAEYQFQLTESNFSRPENIMMDTTIAGTTLVYPGRLKDYHNYRWRVRARTEHTDGNWSEQPFFYTSGYTPTTAEEPGGSIPDHFVLQGNYPNPFNPSTQIRFGIPEASRVQIRVYDITGREVRMLVDEVKNRGYHQVTFDSQGLSSGIYMYRVRAIPAAGAAGDVFMETRTMTLIK